MPKVVNLGSLCIDRVYRVPRFAETGETLPSLTYNVYPGGKGLNQSIALARAGAEVSHVGCIGSDGVFLLEALRTEGIDVSHVELRAGFSGSACIQVDDRGENAIVMTGGANRRLAKSQLSSMVAMLQPNDWLLLQNEVNDLQSVLQRSALSQCSVVFNLAPVDQNIHDYDLRLVDYLIMNEIEALALSRTSSIRDAFSWVGEHIPTCHTVITLGAKGLFYLNNANTPIQISAISVNSVDGTGAGDTFIGFFVGALLKGQSVNQALQFGSAAGALSTTKPGAASSIPTLAEVERLLPTV